MKGLKLFIAFAGALLFLLVNGVSPLVAQTTNIAMAPDAWIAQDSTISFEEHRGQPAMVKLTQRDRVFVKDVVFTDGTIEFDADLNNTGVTLYFRYQDEQESEIFYFRGFRKGNPGAYDVVQYAPVIKGVLHWNVFGQYQGPAQHNVDDWTHFKLIVKGARMQLFIHDMQTPALDIPHLEGTTTSGQIGFEGASPIANLTITPEVPNNFPPANAADPLATDPHYLRDWEISPAFELPVGHEMASANRNFVESPYLPDSTTTWTTLNADRRGLINATKVHGISDVRRGTWLRTTLKSEGSQVRRIDFGFLDEVWVLLNGQLVYVDKNTYNNPIMKYPAGRMSVESTSFELPLREGENEILVGLANSFWTWAIVARIDDLGGITL